MEVVINFSFEDTSESGDYWRHQNDVNIIENKKLRKEILERDKEIRQLKIECSKLVSIINDGKIPRLQHTLSHHEILCSSCYLADEPFATYRCVKTTCPNALEPKGQKYRARKT